MEKLEFRQLLRTFAFIQTVILLLLYLLNCMTPDGRLFRFLRYTPKKRYQIWRFLTYTFVHQNKKQLLATTVHLLLIGLWAQIVFGYHWVAVVILYTSGSVVGALVFSIVIPGEIKTNQIDAILGIYGAIFSIAYFDINLTPYLTKGTNYTLIILSGYAFLGFAVSICFMGRSLYRNASQLAATFSGFALGPFLTKHSLAKNVLHFGKLALGVLAFVLVVFIILHFVFDSKYFTQVCQTVEVSNISTNKPESKPYSNEPDCTSVTDDDYLKGFAFDNFVISGLRTTNV